MKCCLRYEYDTYEALQKELPPLGSDVVTSRGRARVLAQEILAGQLLLEMEDHRRLSLDASEVLTVLSRGSSRGKSRGPRGENGRSGGDGSPDGPTTNPADADDWDDDSPDRRE